MRGIFYLFRNEASKWKLELETLHSLDQTFEAKTLIKFMECFRGQKFCRYYFEYLPHDHELKTIKLPVITEPMKLSDYKSFCSEWLKKIIQIVKKPECMQYTIRKVVPLDVFNHQNVPSAPKRSDFENEATYTKSIDIYRKELVKFAQRNYPNELKEFNEIHRSRLELLTEIRQSNEWIEFLLYSTLFQESRIELPISTLERVPEKWNKELQKAKKYYQQKLSDLRLDFYFHFRILGGNFEKFLVTFVFHQYAMK